MSFIYNDKNLIESLLKAGLDFENKFNKRAVDPNAPAAGTPVQTAPPGSSVATPAAAGSPVTPPTVTPGSPAPLTPNRTPEDIAKQSITENIALAKKLLEHRLREVDPKSAETASHISSDTDTGLKMTDLVNLGTLIRFLATNNIKYDGQPIAYKYDPNNQAITKLNDDNNAVFISATTGTEVDFQKEEEGYIANKTLLANYLKHLRAKSQGNPVFRTPVGKMIDQLNMRFPTPLVEPVKKSEPGKPAEPADNVVLDSLVKIMTIHAGNPQLKGPVVLTARDIRTDTNLNAWLSSNNIAWQIGEELGKWTADERTFVFGDVKNYNKCGIVHVLYTRARNLVGNAQTPEQKANYTYYMTQMLETGRQMTGPDGTACPVTTAPGATPQPTPGTTQPGQPGKPGELTPEQNRQRQKFFQAASQWLPFENGVISFGNIQRFLNQISKLAEEPTFVTTLNALTARFNQMYGEVNAMLHVPSDRFVLTRSASSLNQMMKPGVSPVALIRNLEGIIILGKQAVDLFRGTFADQMSKETKAIFLNAVNEHIGYGSDASPGGYAGNNLADLRALAADLPSSFQKAMK